MTSEMTTFEPATTPDGPDPRAHPSVGIRRRHDLVAAGGSFFAFIAIFVVYAVWLGGSFMSVDGRMLDLSQNVPALLLCLSAVTCLAAHQFDLSTGATATLASFVVVEQAANRGWPIGTAILAAIVIGAIVGVINGVLVTRLNVNAFIATLGSGGVITGIAAVYAHGGIVTPKGSNRLPRWFSGAHSFGNFQTKVPAVVGIGVLVLVVGCALVATAHHLTDYGVARRRAWLISGAVSAVVAAVAIAIGIPTRLNWTITALLLTATALWFLLTYTGFGRSVYASGGNARAARFVGVNVERITITVFVLSGALAASAGVVLAAMQGSALPGSGEAILLPAYSAAFLSTVLLSRGRFHVWGAIAGGVFLVYVSAGLVRGGLHFTWTAVINGIVLLLAVTLSSRLRRARA